MYSAAVINTGVLEVTKVKELRLCWNNQIQFF